MVNFFFGLISYLQKMQSMRNSYFNLISYLSDNAAIAQLFLQTYLLPYRQRSYCSAVSSTSSLILETTQSMLNCFFNLISYLRENAVIA
jgi:hypothetical protein